MVPPNNKIDRASSVDTNLHFIKTRNSIYMPYKWIYAAIDENKKFAFIHSFYHYISLSALLCSFTKRVSSIQDITDKLRDNESLFFSIVFLLLRKLVDLFYFFLFLDKCAYYYVTWAAHILWYWYLCGEKNERNTNFSSKFLKIFDCLRNLFNYTIHCIKHRYER